MSRFLELFAGLVTLYVDIPVLLKSVRLE